MKRILFLGLFCFIVSSSYCEIVNITLRIGEQYTIKGFYYDASMGSITGDAIAVEYGNASITVYAIKAGYASAANVYNRGTVYVFHVVDVTSISIPSNVEMYVGEFYKFNPIITDKEATTTLTWTSSNIDIATVGPYGGVTAKAPGKTLITCTAANGVFTQSLVTIPPVLAQAVTIDKLRHEMNVGGSLTLAATIAPENATNKTVKWLSSNENIAQVDDDGNVVAIAPGYCSIYAKADDGSGKFGKCLIHVLGTANVNGDMNGDGKVAMTDAVKVIDIILEK